jgi:hypothetical protein
MRDRASNITKILSLFRQTDTLELTAIAGTLVIEPSMVRDFCHDLVKSGLLIEASGTNHLNPVYTATERLDNMDNHIYEMIGELFDDVDETQDKSFDFVVKPTEITCIMAVDGYCGDTLKDVPCTGSEFDRLRCYKWVKV